MQKVEGRRKIREEGEGLGRRKRGKEKGRARKIRGCASSLRMLSL